MFKHKSVINFLTIFLVLSSLILPEDGSADGSLGTESMVPGTNNTFNSFAGVSVGLAESGEAFIAGFRQPLSQIWGAYRASRSDSWSVAAVGNDAVTRPVVAMNDKGDIAVVWIGSDTISAKYKPAGLPWEAVQVLETNDDIPVDIPGVAINSKGDVVVAWPLTGAANAVHSVIRSAAGPWPSSPDTVDSNTGGAISIQAAIDDNMNAALFWSEAYGKVIASSNINYAHIVQSLRSGGAWGAKTVISPTQNIGFNHPCDASVVNFPSALLPPLAVSDPETGVLGVGFVFHPNHQPYQSIEDDCLNPPGNDTLTSFRVSWGTVVAGVSGGTNLGSNVSFGPGGTNASTALGTDGGFGMAAAFSSVDMGFIGTNAGKGQPAPGNFGTVISNTAKNAIAGDIGGDGTAFFTFSDGGATTVQVSILGSTLTGPQDLFPATRYASLAANCRGDALFAGANANNASLHVADYVSTNQSCSSIAPTPTATATATATPTLPVIPTKTDLKAAVSSLKNIKGISSDDSSALESLQDLSENLKFAETSSELTKKKKKAIKAAYKLIDKFISAVTKSQSNPTKKNKEKVKSQKSSLKEKLKVLQKNL